MTDDGRPVQPMLRRRRRAGSAAETDLLPDSIAGDIGDETPCEVCAGTGTFNGERCASCDGLGLGSVACFLCGGHDRACVVCGRAARVRDDSVPHGGHDPECADAGGSYLHQRCTCGREASTPWDAIVLDPPWQESGGGRYKRGAQAHYSLMPTAKMPAAIEGSGVWQFAPRALCWMWVTSSFLEDGLWLLHRLGFKRCGMFVWAKIDKMGEIDRRDLFSAPAVPGLGQWSRVEHELLLLGRRGKVDLPAPADRERTVIYAPRAAHSVKPEEAWDVIEGTCRSSFHGRFAGCEFFARRRRPGWHAWGNDPAVRRGAT